MRTITPVRREDVKDPIGITGWPRQKGRDGERTPMQWSPGAQAGFSTGSAAWLPVAQNHVTVNVATELEDPQSTLQWYRQLLRLRRDTPALTQGRMTMLNRDNPHVLTYVRSGTRVQAVMVALNFTAEPQILSIARGAAGPGAVRCARC